jgi:cardiolipin synthase (CMP-forming)
MRARHIPNALTLLRIAVAVLFPLFDRSWWLGLILLALVTEYLDGALSRKFHWESELGQLLDPIADKFLFTAVAAMFYVHGIFSLTEIVMLAVRDLTVAFAAVAVMLFDLRKMIPRAAPSFSGKLTTALQYGVFLSCFLWLEAKPFLVAATFIIGGYAATQYVLRFSTRKQLISQ